MLTKMHSKKDALLELFFNSPQQWHFEELGKKAKLSRPQLSRWLKVLEKEEVILRIKKKGKMPYYLQNGDNAKFRNKKKLFSSEKFVQTGFFDHLASLEKAKVVILFGSFSRWDWYGHSDIDIFIYGDYDGFDQRKYETRLNREIQIHAAKDRKDLEKIYKMLPYIIAGDFIKGSVQDLGVEIHATA